LAVFAAVALAESWQGRLIDGECYEHEPNRSAASCDPTTATTLFGLVTSHNKVYNLDEAGNAKASAAAQSRLEKSIDLASLPSVSVKVKITGTMRGGVLKVKTLEVQ